MRLSRARLSHAEVPESDSVIARPASTNREVLTKRQRYERVRTTLWNERSTFDATWREAGEFISPYRPRFMVTDKNKGDRRSQKILDSTGTMASQILQSGLHAGLTSPARPWMKLSVPDPGMARFKPVQRWLHDVTERMHVIFQLSNLYNALPLLYGDMSVFGTSAMGVVDDPGTPGRSGDLFRCYPYPIGSYAFGIDNRGLVNTFVREYSKTVEQLIAEFGGDEGQPLRPGAEPTWTNFSTTVKNLYERGTTQALVEVCWVVQPTDDYRPGTLGYRSFPWTSCHFEKGAPGEDVVLREAGYHEFPILGPRWGANAEETYGTNYPGVIALPDIKQLQKMQHKKAKAIDKMVDPPLIAPPHMRNQKVSILAGDINYADITGREGAGIRPVHEVQPNLEHFVADIQDVRYRIQQAFYVDLIQMLGLSDPSRGSQPITAREVDERHEEKLLSLGPVLESTIDELLDPLIDRVFAMMARQNLLPPPPPDLQGVELTVEFTSILAQAQKMVPIVGLDRFIAFFASFASSDQRVLAKVNTHALVDEYAELTGVNPNLVRTDQEAQALLDAQAQAQQQQLQAEQFQQTAQGVAALSRAQQGAPV